MLVIPSSMPTPTNSIVRVIICYCTFALYETSTLNSVAFSGWLDFLSTFVEILAVLIHITAGQPTSGTKVTAATRKDDSFAGLRSIYWSRTTMMLTQKPFGTSNFTYTPFQQASSCMLVGTRIHGLSVGQDLQILKQYPLQEQP